MSSNPISPTGEPNSQRFEDLILAAQSGDDRAISKLIHDCQGYLLAIANQELNSGLNGKVGASDLVQETMMSAQRCLGEFHGTKKEELLAWLRGILLNDLKQVRRHFQAARRDVRRERADDRSDVVGQLQRTADDELTPSREAITREESGRLRQAIQGLSVDDQDVLEMRNWQGLSFEEIGERTGRTADAARKAWSRAILRLQSKLDSHRD